MTKPTRTTARRTSPRRKTNGPDQKQDVAQTQAAPSEPDHVARQFGLRTILSRPIYLPRSDWLEHIPFAFWLMEAQRPARLIELGTDCGASYFAFCQAAERLEIDIDCFGIGRWPADPEGEARFAALTQHNEAHYSAFSRLQRGEPEEEAGYFADTAVDLLHIAGTRSYHRTRAAFESWLPNLSERAVVLLHDSDRRGNGRGVAGLVAELRGSYPVFEFRHGHGLAVVAVGPTQTDPLSWLFEAGKSVAARSAIQNTFGRLGRACGDSYLAQEYQGLYHQGRSQIVALKDQINGLLEQVGPRAEVNRPPLAPPLAPASALAPALEPKPGPAPKPEPEPEPEPAHPAVYAGKIAELQAELDAAQAEVQERYEEVAALIQVIQELEREKNDGQGTKDRMRETFEAETATMRKVLSDREKALETLRDDLKRETDHRTSVERMVQEIQSSRSWQITAPLRGIISTLRRQ